MDLGSFFAVKVFVCLAGQTGFCFSCQLCKQKISSLRAVWCCLYLYVKKRIRSSKLVQICTNLRLKCCSLVWLIFKNLTHRLNKNETKLLMKKSRIISVLCTVTWDRNSTVPKRHYFLFIFDSWFKIFTLIQTSKNIPLLPSSFGPGRVWQPEGDNTGTTRD